MKTLKGSIVLAASLSLFAANSACIAAGFIEEAIRQAMPNPGNSAFSADEAHRQLEEPIDRYREYGNSDIRRETDQGDRNLYRLNLCYSEPKPTWCK